MPSVVADSLSKRNDFLLNREVHCRNKKIGEEKLSLILVHRFDNSMVTVHASALL